MNTWHHPLHANQMLDLAAQPGDGFHLLICKGRATQVRVPCGWNSVSLALSGRLALASGATLWELCQRQCQVWIDGALQLSMRSPGWWLSVAAPAVLWQQLPGQCLAQVHGLLPREFTADRELIRRIIQAVRQARPSDPAPASKQTKLIQLRTALHVRQQVLQERLQRCSGRTPLRRHQTLLRLLRVQHLIRHTTADRLDLNQLAASANYSPTHLIRAYRDVFDETPSEFAARLRHLRAWELVRTTRLSISEISQSLGFESESAFCRAFKHAFGLTTGEARRLQPATAS